MFFLLYMLSENTPTVLKKKHTFAMHIHMQKRIISKIKHTRKSNVYRQITSIYKLIGTCRHKIKHVKSYKIPNLIFNNMLKLFKN